MHMHTHFFLTLLAHSLISITFENVSQGDAPPPPIVLSEEKEANSHALVAGITAAVVTSAVASLSSSSSPPPSFSASAADAAGAAGATTTSATTTATITTSTTTSTTASASTATNTSSNGSTSSISTIGILAPGATGGAAHGPVVPSLLLSPSFPPSLSPHAVAGSAFSTLNGDSPMGAPDEGPGRLSPIPAHIARLPSASSSTSTRHSPNPTNHRAPDSRIKQPLPEDHELERMDGYRNSLPDPRVADVQKCPRSHSEGKGM